MPDELPPTANDANASVELERLRLSEEQLQTENDNLRQALSELEHVRYNYFELFDRATVPLVAHDEHRIIQYANFAATQLLGPGNQLIVGQKLHRFIYVEDQALLDAHLLACRELRGGIGDVGVRLSSRLAPVRLKSSYIQGPDGAVMMGALLDDTDNARALLEREKLVDAEQLARRENASKDQFIAMLSHELRTPLTPILAASSQFKEDATIDPTLRRVFARIARNASAEARLIDDLLDATGIMRGKMSIVSVATDVHELLNECVEALRPEAALKQQHVDVELGAKNPWVSGDALRLKQVFTNLLRNAIKFTPIEGTVQIRSWNGRDGLAVEVEDSGVGLAPESTRRIFEPFDQIKEGPSAGGLGLGLAIAKGLLSLHDGKIEATSRGRGQGARFVVELPLLTTPVQAQKSEPGTTYSFKRTGSHLLLVEDNEDTAEVFCELLQRKGYTVVIADSVASALALDGPSIDVVISDLGLPDGTGMELIRQLQARRHRPAIALSGFGMDRDVQASKRAGFDLHLTKPVTAGQLIAALEALGTT